MKLLLKGLELLLDITLLKRLKDHIDIKYVVPTEMVKKRMKKKPNLVIIQTLDLILLKFLSNALQLNL